MTEQEPRDLPESTDYQNTNERSQPNGEQTRKIGGAALTFLQKNFWITRHASETESSSVIARGYFSNVPGSPYTRQAERYVETRLPQRLAARNPGKSVIVTATVTRLRS